MICSNTAQENKGCLTLNINGYYGKLFLKCSKDKIRFPTIADFKDGENINSLHLILVNKRAQCPLRRPLLSTVLKTRWDR